MNKISPSDDSVHISVKHDKMPRRSYIKTPPSSRLPSISSYLPRRLTRFLRQSEVLCFCYFPATRIFWRWRSQSGFIVESLISLRFNNMPIKVDNDQNGASLPSNYQPKKFRSNFIANLRSEIHWAKHARAGRHGLIFHRNDGEWTISQGASCFNVLHTSRLLFIAAVQMLCRKNKYICAANVLCSAL